MARVGAVTGIVIYEGVKELEGAIETTSVKAVGEWCDKKVRQYAFKQVPNRKLAFDKYGHEKPGVRSRPNEPWKSHKAYPGFRTQIKVLSKPALGNVMFGYIPGEVKPEVEKLGDVLEFGGYELESQRLANLRASGKLMSKEDWESRNRKWEEDYNRRREEYNFKRRNFYRND